MLICRVGIKTERNYIVPLNHPLDNHGSHSKRTAINARLEATKKEEREKDRGSA